MATRAERYKQAPQTSQERRAGESALSDFANYVEKQQALRKPPTIKANGSSKVAPPKQEHSELDILDTKDDSTKQVLDIVSDRLDEGHGECIFDVGLEDNGDSQLLTPEEWDTALSQLQDVLAKLKFDLRTLMTKNVADSIVDVGNDLKKERGCIGKFLIRRRLENASVDAIETR
ncbi:hypothetical protein LTR49_028247 [Elasticomyces elasticus]|nr:hypothetical protein LTR49_028247 [Elasticomyces elasticus]KAK5732844.1 hypothetical protein LTS12_027052 [Elasticomyces elasticus]